jgi:hypothetical protein
MSLWPRTTGRFTKKTSSACNPLVTEPACSREPNVVASGCFGVLAMDSALSRQCKAWPGPLNEAA